MKASFHEIRTQSIYEQSEYIKDLMVGNYSLGAALTPPMKPEDFFAKKYTNVFPKARLKPWRAGFVEILVYYEQIRRVEEEV